MENPTHGFRETNLVLQLILESQIKSKTVMSWSSRKKRKGIFCTVYFVRRKFFNICFLSQCIVYWIHFQNIHTFTYQKILLHTLFCLFLKLSKSFSVSLKFQLSDLLELWTIVCPKRCWIDSLIIRLEGSSMK